MREKLSVEEDHGDYAFETFERADEISAGGPGVAGVDIEELKLSLVKNLGEALE